jgi:hypothetical protein
VAEGPAGRRPAWYALQGRGWRGWWTVLHPPYTAWHLGYVVIGACLAPTVSPARLGWTLGAFFLAVGVAAHALDELNGRPLATAIPPAQLLLAAVLALLGAVAIGAYLVTLAGWTLLAFLLAGPLLVVAYNAELFGGILHNDAGFAASWGAFPVLAAYDAQAGTVRPGALLAAGGALALSITQRRLSTPARLLRRQALEVDGAVLLTGGSVRRLDRATLLGPLEAALHAACWGVVLLAAALATFRLG